MRTEWRPAAKADLLDLIGYIAQDSLSAALRMHDAITAAVEGLPTHPQRGRPGRLDGTRELVVPRTPYVVVYSASVTTIEVLRILHGAGRPRAEPSPARPYSAGAGCCGVPCPPAGPAGAFSPRFGFGAFQAISR